MSWHVEVSAIERRFHGNLLRHDGPERLTRTNVDSTSFCYVCVYMLVFTYPLFNHRKDIYIYAWSAFFESSCYAYSLWLCFQTDYVKKKGDSSKPSFTVYVFFFQFFPCLIGAVLSWKHLEDFPMLYLVDCRWSPRLPGMVGLFSKTPFMPSPDVAVTASLQLGNDAWNGGLCGYNTRGVIRS